ncbi:MAG: hypothetical protein ACYC46_12815 [Acidobacteriaceae bacterium]
MDPRTAFPPDLDGFPSEAFASDSASTATKPQWVNSGLENDPRWQLAHRIVASKSFAKSALLAKFLLYVCERELTGRTEEISEQQIGVQVFGRRPGYSPGEDNIVRSYARQLRQRLDHYFEEDGRHGTLKITIPRGTYVPAFTQNHTPEWAPVDSPGEETAAPTTLPTITVETPVTPAPRKRWLMLYALSFLVFVCTPLVWFFAQRILHQNAASPRILWAQMFDENHQTYLVPADDGIVMIQNLTGHLVHLADYISRDYISLKSPHSVDAKNMADLDAQRYTSVTDLNAVLRFSSLPENHSGHTIVRYARELHIEDLKDSNAILLGSTYSNPWVELFEKNLNFEFNYRPSPNVSFILNRHPQPGEASVYQNDAVAPSHQTYAVIALTHNLNSTGWVLIVAGLTMAGTQAAVDTLFDPQAMQPILEKARNTDGMLRPFEMLIETRSFGSNSPQASVIASRFYPK